jgi:hypothetical protein
VKVKNKNYKIGKTMNKHIFSLFITVIICTTNITLSCPCEFSSDDERPFFEQYEIKSNTQEKDKKS